MNTDLERLAASELLEASGRSVKLALLMHWTGVNQETGQQALADHQGQLRPAMASINQSGVVGKL